MGDLVVDMSGVRVVRGGFALLDGVDWQVRESQRWVVVGPNGAGKTTLLRVAAAMLHPTAGAVGLLGETVGRYPVHELRQRIGLASLAVQEALSPHERVLDTVLTAAYARLGRWTEDYDPEDVDRARALLGGMGVAGLAEHRVGTLSEGERKRVLVARALMVDPELLLLDEPAAGLDLGAREQLVATLDDLAADPTAPTMVLVTHHVEEIPPGITHALLLRHGRVVAQGPVGQTLTGPLLTACFGIPLQVEHRDGRWIAWASRPAPEPNPV